MGLEHKILLDTLPRQEMVRGLILARSVNEAFLIHDFAWVRLASIDRIANTFWIHIWKAQQDRAIKDSLSATKLICGSPYIFRGTDYRLSSEDLRRSRFPKNEIRFHISAPKDVGIFREEFLVSDTDLTQAS